MGILGPDGAHLDVGALGLQQLLVDVRVAVAHARRVLVGEELARLVTHLQQVGVRPGHNGLQPAHVGLRPGRTRLQPRGGRLQRKGRPHLAEEPLRAAAERARVVEVDVVVLAGDGLLDERLLDALAVHLEVLLLLVDDVVLARVEHHVVRHRHAVLLQYETCMRCTVCMRRAMSMQCTHSVHAHAVCVQFTR